MTQYVINIGAIPNDGTGDPLRTAFNETNLNFDQVFAAGPVLSNIQIANNTILTTNTNGNLVLAPNGTAVVQSNVNIVPNTANIRNLGSATRRWATVYTQYLNVSAGTSVNGNLTVDGNLIVMGNVVNMGNIVTDTLTIQLANTANSANSANGAGITVGLNDNIATMLYNSAGNVWAMNIGLNTPNLVVNNISSDDSTFVTVQDGLDVQGDITAETVSTSGNITADYFIGDGSLLTGIASSYGNSNVATFMAAFGSNTISTTGNVTVGNILPAGYVSATGNVRGANFNTVGTVSATGNITGDYFIGNGSQLTGLPASYGNANVAAYLPTYSGNISAGNVGVSGAVNAVGEITSFANLVTTGEVQATGNVVGDYFIGNGSELTNLPAPTVTQDITSTGAMSIMLYDGNIKYNNYATVEPSSGNITGGNISATGNIIVGGSGGDISGTGNITAAYFIGNGSQLTGISAASTGNLEITGTLIEIAAGATETSIVISPSGPTGGQAFVDVPDNATANTADLRIYNSLGNIELGTNSGNSLWSFGSDGRLTFPGTPRIDTDANNFEVQAAESINFEANAVVNIYTDTSGTTYQWQFGDDGNLNLPPSGNIVGVTANNNGYINWLGNSSGDGYGYTTMRLVPDDTVGGDSYLIIDPTAPNHIHIRAGGAQDNSGAQLFLGGENSYFLVENGANSNVYVASNSNQWKFDTTGILTLPGEGVLQSLNDTVTLSSLNTTTGNANSVYLGTSGGLGFNDGEIGGNWLEIFRNGTEPEIRVPVGLGNLNIQTASGNTPYNWTFDDTGNLTVPGNIVMPPGSSLVGNGASPAPNISGFNSATFGAGVTATGNITGGNILTAGLISATGNVTAGNFIGISSNVTLVAGSYSWTFDNTGNLTIPAAGDILLANTQSTISAAGNITAGNISAGGATNISNVTINSYTSVPQLWFKGTLSTDQSLTTSNDTIILYNTNTDPLSWGNVSNGQVTPTKSGWYEVVSRVQFSAIAGNVNAQINHQIAVNGVQQAIAQVPNNAVVGAGVAVVATAMVNLNGTTDYITTSCYTTVTGQTCVGSTSTMLLVRWIST